MTSPKPTTCNQISETDLELIQKLSEKLKEELTILGIMDEEGEFLVTSKKTKAFLVLLDFVLKK